MPPRSVWTAVAAYLAVVLALAAVGAVITKLNTKPAPVQPIGVCVVTDPYAFGTDGGGPYAAVRSVTAPVRRDGVLSCTEGQFVSVAAK